MFLYPCFATSKDSKMGMENLLSQGEIIEDRYKIMRHFANGSFGPLYVAESTRVPKQFILKINLPHTELSIDDYVGSSNVCKISRHSHIARTENEIDVTCRMRHRNIINLIDSVKVRDRYQGIITEEIENAQTLKQFIDHLRKKGSYGPDWQGRLYGDTPDEAFRFALQISDAVSYIRQQGYLHKDLKPENILVSNGTDIKIIDFGISCRIDEPNGLFGNRLYSPPEYFAGWQHEYSDYWSNAVINIELLTGQYIFGDKTPENVNSAMARLVPIMNEETDTLAEKLGRNAWRYGLNVPKRIYDSEFWNRNVKLAKKFFMNKETELAYQRKNKQDIFRTSIWGLAFELQFFHPKPASRRLPIS